MAVFKCKICGGTIEPSEGGIGICDSCGTKQSISTTNDEKKMNLLDRANHFRMQNEFDKALAIYEQVLAEDTNDSDIYYAIALCRYGITYVDDPTTKKKIPTINRMQNKMFTSDPDYVMAINKASSGQSSLYEEEGKYIDKVQTGIMDITKNEKPYDVFICYKETDDITKERTRDSVLANDLYHGLTNEGFKVFFARITLEGKLGAAYEPYIFSALNSSKVMVVLGTKREYFNAVWVKNEWSRFLSLKNEGGDKTLIPAYKDMDPYDLPDEFSNLQALDMSKLGFMQDLIRGIKKIVNKNTGAVSNPIPVPNNATVDQLLKRVRVFLSDGEFNNANKYCEKALDIDAENSDIYLCKVMIDYKCRSEQALERVEEDINSSNNYQKALRFANAVQKKKLIEIRSECLYRKAKKNIESRRFGAAIAFLEKIAGYKDSDTLKKNCQEYIESMLKKQAEEKRRQEEERKERQKREEEERKERQKKEEEERKEREKQEKERKERQLKEEEQQRKINLKRSAIAISILLVVVVACGVINNINKSLEKNKFYKEAEEYVLKNEFNKAIEIYNKYGDNQKSKEVSDLKNRQLYDKAENYISKGDYNNALKVYNELGDSVKVNEIKLAANIQMAKPVTNYTRGQQMDGTISTVKFGEYFQANTSNKEPIEWVVLERRADKALLLSRYILDCKCYSDELKDITWGDSDLRKWLNNDFYNSAFSGEEKIKIETTNVINNYNGNNEFVLDSNNTDDKVFCLSSDEVNKYFNKFNEEYEGGYDNKMLATEGTRYAQKNGVKVGWIGGTLALSPNGEKVSSWRDKSSFFWLRTPGYVKDKVGRVALVDNSGYLWPRNNDCNTRGVGVRPAIWVSYK